MKNRADIILYEKGLVESKEVGQSLIMKGIVYIDNVKIDKPGEIIDINSSIEIRKKSNIYVSRGGLKLEKAILDFQLSLQDYIAMDIGSSTGGFTDCMLKNGAAKVFAIDVGYGQLDWKLRNDPRVVVMERTNIRNVTKEDIKESIDFISIDVSFISLKLVLPISKDIMSKDGKIIALIKPQFEAEQSDVGKGGIVRDKDIHYKVIKDIISYCNDIGLGSYGLTYSPITGAKGNIEFLIYLKNNDTKSISDDIILKNIDDAHNNLN